MITNQNFVEWEKRTMGYGYGTGEEHTIPALRNFLYSLPDGNYNFEHLEKLLGATVAWLLINIFCKADILEYGTSPRFGWLSPKGKLLKEFTDSKTVDELYEMIMDDQYDDFCECNGKIKDHKDCDKNPLLFNV